MFRKLLKGISLTAAMFVFQACYGTMEDYKEYHVTFHVTDAKDGKPLEGVAVNAEPLYGDSTRMDTGYSRLLGYTDSNGCCSAWTYYGLTLFSLQAEDGSYASTDTIISAQNLPDTVHIALRHTVNAD